MRKRLNTLGIKRIKSIEILNHLIELRLNFFTLRLAELKPCKLLKRRIDRPGRARSVDSYENCSFACFVEVCHHT